VLGLVEQRREQDQFRARGGNLAQLPEAVGGRAGNCGRLDALHALPVQPLQRLVRPAAGARRVLVDRHVDAFGNLEVRHRTARLLQSAVHRLDLFGERHGGRRARAEETVALPHGTPQRGRPRSPEPQRRIRLLERLGLHARVVKLPELPRERHPLLGPQRLHQRDAFGEPCHVPVRIDAERGERPHLAAATNPRLDPAPAGAYWSGPGRAWLVSLELPAVSRELVEDGLALIGALQDRIARLDWEIRQRARSDPRVKVLTQLPGTGPFTALVILAEIGEVSRFGPARKLASWAGLTPTVRGSDRVAHYGHISKEGSVWLRWVLCEAAQTAKRHPQFAASYQAIATRRGKKIATTAVARKLLTRAWHLLTDAEHAAAPQPATPQTAAR
jgi:hypothetical protein